MNNEVQARADRIHKLMEAAVDLVAEASRINDPNQGADADEIRTIMDLEVIQRLSIHTYIEPDGQVEISAYDSHCDESRSETVSFKEMISSFLFSFEGADDKEACAKIRAELEVALALLPPS